MTAGVAMLSLYCWLVGLKQQVDQFGSSTLPATLAIITDKVFLLLCLLLLCLLVALLLVAPWLECFTLGSRSAKPWLCSAGSALRFFACCADA